MHISIADKDFYLGLPRHEHHRVARIVQPNTFEFVYEMASTVQYYPLIFTCLLTFFDCDMYKAGKYPLWLSFLDVSSNCQLLANHFALTTVKVPFRFIFPKSFDYTFLLNI